VKNGSVSKMTRFFPTPVIAVVLWACRLTSACHLFVHEVCLQDSWSETIAESLFSLHSPDLSQLNTLTLGKLHTLTSPRHVAFLQSRIHSHISHCLPAHTLQWTQQGYTAILNMPSTYCRCVTVFICFPKSCNIFHLPRVLLHNILLLLS